MSVEIPPVPNPDEVATVVCNGQEFDAWETVLVQIRYGEAWPLFRLAVAEVGSSIPQWMPGDKVQIYLGGALAMNGIITVRQVAYDAESHGVQFQGKGATWYPAKSSAGAHDPTGNYDGMTFEQVARKVLAPFGVGVKTIGTLDATPFVRLQQQKGELVWNFLERLARPRGIVLGSDGFGNFLLIEFAHPAAGRLANRRLQHQAAAVDRVDRRHDVGIYRVRPDRGERSELGPAGFRARGQRAGQRHELCAAVDAGRAAGLVARRDR